jgi:SAM-dependent methyltransferase
VLSFGCSTGEECATIRWYWPAADIVGVDVNEDSLAKARRRAPDARLRHAAALPDLGKFDLVLALSVLCRHRDTQDREDIATTYPFRMFEEAVGRLVSVVNRAGVLVILNANYRFEDTTHAADFRPLLRGTFTDEVHNARVRKFGPDGHLLADQAEQVAFVRSAATVSGSHRS